MKKKTIYDLAEMAGASPSTVSAALNGSWKTRRIREETAREIQRLAQREGYRTNLQARGLRRSRSGLAGLIMPEYTDRFFAGLAECFEAEARRRGFCPVTVCTARDADEEQRTVDTLIAYAVEMVFVAGARDPDAISRRCMQAQIHNINIDLPGTLAPSVVTDNHGGAVALTEALVARIGGDPAALAGRITLIGGDPDDFATRERIAGFREVVIRRTGRVDEGQVIASGYDPARGAEAARRLFCDPATAPLAVFVNSTLTFEGVAGFLATLPPERAAAVAVGCFDYDPVARYLRFPVIMVRQDVERLVAEAFHATGAPGAGQPIRIPPQLIDPADT